MSALPRSYRADIDGLRAVAVLGVVAFHAFPERVPGGFIGVDIFFVISGFLISSIIFAEVEADRFSLRWFYWRRVRRIFPALVLVLATVLAVGWSMLLPDEFANAGKHAAAGAAFVANIALWNEHGYFDTASELKPLLHLWSLGIEEQYYLVWPVAIVLMRRWRAIGVFIVVVAALSFGANLLWLRYDVAGAFYLPFTRFWQLMAGAGLAYLGRQQVVLADGLRREASSLFGALCLALSFVFIDRTRAFPGWWALLPTVGATLLIAAGPSAVLNRVVLSRRAMVGIGLISYPLYLWHWPLLTWARLVCEGRDPSAVVRVAMVVISGVLALATYRLVERPVQAVAAWHSSRWPTIGGALVTGALSVGLVGTGIALGRAQPRSAGDPALVEVARAARDSDYGPDGTIAGDVSSVTLFIGDSHMQHYVPRIRAVMRRREKPVKTVRIFTKGGCAPIPGIDRGERGCPAYVAAAFDAARSAEVDTVVISASWRGMLLRRDYVRLDGRRTPLTFSTEDVDWMLGSFEAAVQSVVARGKRVVVLLSSPRGPVLDPKSLADHDWFSVSIPQTATRPGVARTLEPIDVALTRVAVRAGATIVDPTAWICEPEFCPAIDRQQIPIYLDTSHVRASFSRDHIAALDPYIEVAGDSTSGPVRGAPGGLQ